MCTYTIFRRDHGIVILSWVYACVDVGFRVEVGNLAST